MPELPMPCILAPSRRLVLPLLAMILMPSALTAQTSPQPESSPAPAPLPPSADASSGELREVAERPSMRLGAKTTWVDGLATIGKTLKVLTDEVGRLGLRQNGNPVSHFLESDDLGFSFDLHLPVEAGPVAGQTLDGGVSFTPIPGGRAAIFSHEGAYDDIDAAYEAIAAWLDERGLTATGRFLEEYLALPAQGDDPGMKLGISIFLK